ncbi:MAG TPA: glycosyltransferase family 39 protein [Vicinamibacterales bacterium]|nr:glycosyltransferase family 39 protein [Vicinamibacterales bacterium]
MRGAWPALVLALCCLPLFVDLGRRDLQNDEAIYSFTTDRILETGDWLNLRASPHEDGVPFLEKPPLKFWLVAAPIRLGLLPHDEFGLRFWDALFGSLAFLYVFLIGRQLFDPMTGAFAALVLFAHDPLLFEHGLRENTMDAALVLSYTAGVYHFVRWLRAERQTQRWVHALLVVLYFVLGFMTKFVAALFLPLILGVTVLLSGEAWTRMKSDWKIWAAAKAIGLLLIAPWFVYAQMRYGASYWNAIFGEHVYHRFSGYLDPAHVQPWYYYPAAIFSRWSSSGSFFLAAIGTGLVAYRAIKTRWVEGALLLIWFALPIALISIGTSKLYHYLYPFFPPFALAAGYLVSVLFALAASPFERGLAAVSEWLKRKTPGAVALVRWPIVRVLCAAMVVFAVALAASSIVWGQVTVPIGQTMALRSSSVLRPMLVAFVFALMLGMNRKARAVALPVMIACLLPWPAYRAALVKLADNPHPVRSTAQCVQQVEATMEGPPRGLYVQWGDYIIWHTANYYFRHVRPWQRSMKPSPQTVDEALHDPQKQRPVMMAAVEGESLARAEASRGVSAADLSHDVLVLLPGPFQPCAPGVADADSR